MKTRVQGKVWGQGCREIVRSEVQEQWREQTSKQSCENKGPATVVSRKVQGDLWEQGCRERVKKGVWESCKDKSPGSWEQQLWEEDCTGSVSCSIRHQWQTTSLNTLLKDNSKNYVMYLAWGLALFHCTGGMGVYLSAAILVLQFTQFCTFMMAGCMFHC